MDQQIFMHRAHRLTGTQSWRLASASIQASSPAPGRVVVGATRLGASGGLGGGGVVLTLEFALAGTGSGDINFSDTRTFSPNGQAQIGVSWLGGTVRAGV
mgnify:CR=1 FL=1